MIKQSPPTSLREIHAAVELIRSAKSAVALTGAGSSTPSGIPDFRSEGIGLWNQVSPMEVASLTTFRYYPERFFKWLRPLVSEMVNAKPNPSHFAFTALERGGHVKTIITQNIDGLHQKAGARSVIEIHGSLSTLSCTGCFKQVPSMEFLEPFLKLGRIPLCPHCGKILKPDVVLFEEQLPVKSWLKAREAVRTCDLMIVAGSSLVVMPAAGLPMSAIDHQARLIVINKTPTYIDERSDVVIAGDVSNVLPAIATEVMNG
jgi:NAD-dependent deacetylase